ncbi:MAG: hypothetical protein L0241_30685, partial [Planctomycetia bacterium]|nr:hypothetical protein [Planctomycetia bacterium]
AHLTHLPLLLSLSTNACEPEHPGGPMLGSRRDALLARDGDGLRPELAHGGDGYGTMVQQAVGVGGSGRGHDDRRVRRFRPSGSTAEGRRGHLA